MAHRAQPGAWPGADRPRPAVGRRHHLCAAGRGLCLSRRAARCVQPTGDRLGPGHASAGEPCHGSVADGDRGAPAGAWHPDPSFRSPVQYACSEYTVLLEAHDIQPSMSRVGNPYDNARAESFIKTLKQEEVDGRDYRDLNQAREAIGAFIEDTYNRQRLHSALAYRPPVEFEASLSAGALLRQPPAV